MEYGFTPTSLMNSAVIPTATNVAVSIVYGLHLAG